MTAIVYNTADSDTMARTIWGEARGEPREGQVAVAWVIRNRSQRPGFGGYPGQMGSVYAVCRAPNQFDCWNADDPNLAKIDALTGNDYAAQLEIAQAVLDGSEPDPTGGADFYYAPQGMNGAVPYWAKLYKQTVAIGHQLFFDSRERP